MPENGICSALRFSKRAVQRVMSKVHVLKRGQYLSPKKPSAFSWANLK